MSELWTPPGSNPKPKHPLGVDKLSHGGGHDVKEILPSEFNQLKSIIAQVQGKYASRYATDEVQAQMSLEVQHRLSDELGLLCAIEWLPTDVTHINGEDRPVLSPTVTVTGRTTEIEIDHDRIRAEVQSGELDGIAGKMDQHGTWKE